MDFKDVFNIPSFEGHGLNCLYDYYEGKPWHTTYAFEVDGVRLDMDSYYSQAYTNRPNNEISTVLIENRKKKGVAVSRKVTPDNLITYEDLEILISPEEPEVGGFHYGDCAKITIGSHYKTGTVKVVALFPETGKVRVKDMSNPWLPGLYDVSPLTLTKIPRFQIILNLNGASNKEILAGSKEEAEEIAVNEFSEELEKAIRTLKAAPMYSKLAIDILASIQGNVSVASCKEIR